MRISSGRFDFCFMCSVMNGWRGQFRRLGAAILATTFLFGYSPQSQAYSVLAHEAVIDSAWEIALRPLLLERFPNSTPDQLKEAHSYAYGGAIIADAGYYPFGSKFFSDLLHYVRSADFVEALLRGSQDLNEYAFALGAMAHYVGDNNGHRLAVNLAVPILYPKLERKFGHRVVYDEDPAAHLKTEFGFDAVQVAKGHYAPQSYHDHIGFNVSRPLLEKAFQDTYSLELKSVIPDYDLAIATFRRSVSTVIPEMTRVAWNINKNQIQKEMPGVTRRKFIYNLSRASYQREWKARYQRPGFGAKVLAFIIRIIPKIGPFQTLAFKTPTPQTEQLFMASFNVTLDEYKRLLHDEYAHLQPAIPNDNLDTGTVTGPGEYPLADKTYAELLDKLSKDHFANISPELREIVLAYYRDPGAFATKKNRKDWAKVRKEVEDLQSTPAPPVSEAMPTSLAAGKSQDQSTQSERL
jgi:Zinc dependent phospholipase C